MRGALAFAGELHDLMALFHATRGPDELRARLAGPRPVQLKNGVAVSSALMGLGRPVAAGRTHSIPETDSLADTRRAPSPPIPQARHDTYPTTIRTDGKGLYFTVKDFILR